MTIPDRVTPKDLIGTVKRSFKYKRLTINSALLPLWVRILPGNIAQLEISVQDLDKAQTLTALLHKWFEDLAIKEIDEYEKHDTDLDS